MVNRPLTVTRQAAFMVSMPYDHNQVRQRNFALISLARGLEGSLWTLILLFFSGAIIGLMFTDATALDQSDGTFARLLWYPIYIGVLALSVFQLPRVIRMATFNPLIILAVLWCGLTYFWSVDPGVSLRRSIALLMTTLAGLAFAARFDWSEMVQRIAFVGAILAIVTVLVALGNPERGIMQEIHPGAWRGPWVEKNYLGGMMTKMFAACLCAFAMRPSRGIFWVPMGALCLALVLLSTSKTALLISLSCLALFLVLRIFRRFPFLRVPVAYAFVFFVAALVLVIGFFSEEALALIGKDPTLTGRTDIWYLLARAISEKPLLGYGYGVFWMDPLGPSYEVRTVLQWEVPTAHNGWFDSWLSGGLVIIVIFALLLVTTVLMSIKRIKTGGVETYWAILSVFFFIGFSLSESTILQQNDLSWFLFVATTAKLWAGEPAWWRPGSRPSVARLRIAR